MKTILVIAGIALAAIAVIVIQSLMTSGNTLVVPPDMSQFAKHLDIWFMTFLIAIIMMFIKKFEWGVAVAVLLSAAASYATYFVIVGSIEGFDNLWTQANLIRGAVCSITVVVTIGCFIGTIKMWQYIMVGVLFAPVYYMVEWLCIYFGGIMLGNGNGVMDPGGAILVHMCAAYFGLGVIMTLREKRSFDEPMYSTTHSITFAWIASMLLFMLWPSFVTAFLAPEDVGIATAVCYMAGMGSIISAFITGMILDKKINPGIYAFALLAGCVSMSPVMLIVNPFVAFIIGMIAGVISFLCFKYLQPWLCGKLGALDVMGVHNLHGMAGWFGVILLLIMSGEIAVIEYALAMVAVTVVSGLLVGLVLKYTRGELEAVLDDRTDFIFNEDPEHIEHTEL